MHVAKHLARNPGDPLSAWVWKVTQAASGSLRTHAVDERTGQVHVIAHASHVLDLTRRAEQKRDPEFKGLRWTLLKDRSRLSGGRRADLDALLANLTTKRTARAWQYREDLREILDRKQVNVVRELLKQWCTNVMRSTVEPMQAVARMIRNHLEGIVAWAPLA